jgi:hypothetical protein
MRSGIPTAVRFTYNNGTVLIREKVGLNANEAEKDVFGTESFCELCWRQTEHAEASSGAKRYRRKRGGTIQAVATPVPTSKTSVLARDVLDVFLLACDGEIHTNLHHLALQAGAADWQYVEPTFLAPRMILWIGMMRFLNVRDRFNDCFASDAFGSTSEKVTATPELVDELCALIEDAIVRQQAEPAELAEQPTIRLSRRFCGQHNQRRGGESSRRYKRDHALRAEFEEELTKVGSRLLLDEFFVARKGDLDAMTRIRKDAYRATKASELGPKLRRPSVKNGQTIMAIRQLQAEGTISQSDIARQLGISRAAVSIALKRDVSTEGTGKAGHSRPDEMPTVKGT